MRMTETQRRHINLIANNQFDQDTVKLLLIDVREMTPKGSLIREIGDFIAHPWRDKGITFAEVQSVYDQIVQQASDFFSNERHEQVHIRARAIFGEKEFTQELIQVLRDKGFLDDKGLEKKLGRQMNGIMLCVLCLLAGARIQVEGAIEVSELRLEVSSDGQTLGLGVIVGCSYEDRQINVRWPIVTSTCVLHHSAVKQIFPWGPQQFAVARRNQEGQLTLVRLEEDSNGMLAPNTEPA